MRREFMPAGSAGIAPLLIVLSVVADLVLVALLVAFPALALWLPAKIGV